jgi:hypothetical protein
MLLQETGKVTFTLMDLGTAYRKAKVDLYYSTNPSLLEIADYEVHLEERLESLLSRLNGESEEWVSESTFTGTHTFLPKSVGFKIEDTVQGGVRFSNPAVAWRDACKSAARPVAQFRLTAQCTLDFHVLSSLWIAKVGHRFDWHLSSSAYGNRLRRKRDGEVNALSLGSFSPYLAPFRKWRDNGLRAMRSALEENKKVVALTADVTSFYHQLDPSFLLNSDFLGMLKLDLSPAEHKLNRLFVTALKAWSGASLLGKGLPVGLPASAVVANMALIELDRIMEQEIVPLYYGRYVDDVMLVMENGAEFQSSGDVWEWIFKRSDEKLKWTGSGDADVENYAGVSFESSYLKNSEINFSNEKNRIFLLEGESGMVLVESIARQVHERASEWRSLPNLPEMPGAIATDMVAATQTDGELADNLRKADSLTMRRAGFALKLRSFEAYERDLEPASWELHRKAFYRAFIDHVLILPSFFDLATYLPRVVRLATISKDFDYLADIVGALVSLYREVKKSCDVIVKGGQKLQVNSEDVLSSWWKQLFASVDEAIIAAFPTKLSPADEKKWLDDFASLKFNSLMINDWSIDKIQRTQIRLFDHDLAHVPRRFASLPKELVSPRGIPTDPACQMIDVGTLLQPEVCEGLASVGTWLEWKGKETPLGVAFSTRPYNLAEIYMVAKSPFDETSQDSLNAAVLALRGFKMMGKMPYMLAENGPSSPQTLLVQTSRKSDKKRVALGSWKTHYDSWTASVMEHADPNRDRYLRLTTLVNRLISEPNGVAYLVLPELSMPARWFVRIAQKLQARGISLIAGVEYLHTSPGVVHNQTWTSLIHDGLGFPSMMIYQQDKQRPAHGEEKELHRLREVTMEPRVDWKSPPVIRHGDFSFALLICSELTNIKYRAALSGQVDALFVPEWNKDIGTFDSLVESASLDMHAYIIQCNDRQYGDSRIRAPYKDSWRRDVVRLKGGARDYMVVGDIDVDSLRQFQSSHRSPDAPFKPVPDGFVMAPHRTRLPKIEIHTSTVGGAREQRANTWI